MPTILVTGPVGVGKTTLIDEMSGVLRAAGVPHATVDFDQLTACYPRSPDDDVWGTNLGLTNLAALWRNYQALGADRLLLARVIEDRKELDGYHDAVPGAEIVVVRLRASPSTLQERVRRRGEGRGMQWHLDRGSSSRRSWTSNASRICLLRPRTVGRENSLGRRFGGWGGYPACLSDGAAPTT